MTALAGEKQIDMHSNTCANNVRCPACFMVESIDADDTTLKINRCSDATIGIQAPASAESIHEYRVWMRIRDTEHAYIPILHTQ